MLAKVSLQPDRGLKVFLICRPPLSVQQIFLDDFIGAMFLDLEKKKFNGY